MELIKLVKIYLVYFFSSFCAFVLLIWSKVTHETLEIKNVPDNLFTKYYNFDSIIFIFIALNLVYFLHLFQNKSKLYIIHLVLVIFLICFVFVGYLKRFL
jgi:heme/copper-type cytochrome/quinol oxidase subunit 4